MQLDFDYCILMAEFKEFAKDGETNQDRLQGFWSEKPEKWKSCSCWDCEAEGETGLEEKKQKTELSC